MVGLAWATVIRRPLDTRIRIVPWFIITARFWRDTTWTQNFCWRSTSYSRPYARLRKSSSSSTPSWYQILLTVGAKGMLASTRIDPLPSYQKYRIGWLLKLSNKHRLLPENGGYLLQIQSDHRNPLTVEVWALREAVCSVSVLTGIFFQVGNVQPDFRWAIFQLHFIQPL